MEECYFNKDIYISGNSLKRENIVTILDILVSKIIYQRLQFYCCVGLEELVEPVKQEQRIPSSRHVIKLEQENSLRSDSSFGIKFL